MKNTYEAHLVLTIEIPVSLDGETRASRIAASVADLARTYSTVTGAEVVLVVAQEAA